MVDVFGLLGLASLTLVTLGLGSERTPTITFVLLGTWLFIVQVIALAMV